MHVEVRPAQAWAHDKGARAISAETYLQVKLTKRLTQQGLELVLAAGTGYT